MPNVLDFVEPGPLLSDQVVEPPIVSNATVQHPLSRSVCDRAVSE